MNRFIVGFIHSKNQIQSTHILSNTMLLKLDPQRN